MSDHVTRFTFERHLTGELSASEAEFMRAHVGGCEACARALRALEADAEAFGREMPFVRFRARHDARRQVPSRLRLLLPVLASATAMAAAMAVLVVTHPGAVDERAGIKGDGVALSFAVLEGGALRPGVSGEALPAGAQLQLGYDAGPYGFMAVVGVDGRGQVATHYPDSGDTLAPVPDGPAGRLPFSLSLDGPERFFAVFGRTAASLAEVRRAAASLAGMELGRANRLALPTEPELAQSSVWVH